MKGESRSACCLVPICVYLRNLRRLLVLRKRMDRSMLSRLGQLVVILGGALSLKFYYSTASVNQLRWILTPTTLLVEFVTGRTFAFESHAGYMSSDHTFLIAASCAGVNFLITAFLMISLRQIWRERRSTVPMNWRGWIFLPVSAVIAYLSTIIANTARISIALQLQQTPLKIGSLSSDQVHRLEGVIVYFGFLFLLFVISERPRLDMERKRVQSVKAFGFLRACLFPLLIYYTTTLGLPIANGAYRHASFWQHSLFVVLTPIVVVLVSFTLVCLRSCYRRRI